MPLPWIQDNLFRTIRYFNGFINQQAAEPMRLFFRRWIGSYKTGQFTTFELNTDLDKYETLLWQPPNPRSGGKPRLRTLKIATDGIEMTAQPDITLVTSDNDYYIRLYRSARYPELAGTLFVGFNTDYDPRSHTIEYAYEEICYCIDDGEESFNPNARCVDCYGTGFLGGYDQYLAPAHLEMGRIIKPANTILCRVPMTSETVKISRFGAEISTQRKSWTISIPTVHDWDLLIRLRSFGARVNEDYITHQLPDERFFINDWENSSVRMSYDLPVLPQSRGVTFPPLADVPSDPRGIILHQKFTLSEVQPTHIAYQIPYQVNYPED